jgi:hypothetical protein
MLICAVLILPPNWGMFSGALSFSGSSSAQPDGAGGLAVPLISQYQGLSTDNVNCGPASVAAILRAMRAHGLPLADADLVAATRNGTGRADGDTNAPMLARALRTFGLGSTALLSDDAQDGAGIMAAIDYVVKNHRPVLALVYGADLGRGAQYGDHWLIISAIDEKSGETRVVDPDTQAVRTLDWEPGGIQWIPTWRLSAALRDATGNGTVVALAVGAGRSTPPSPRAVLLPLALLLILWQARGRLLRSLPKRWRRALRHWARR